MKKGIILIGFLLLSFQVNAQFFIGNDLGATRFDISDKLVSEYKYNDLAPGYFNPGIIWFGKRSILSASYLKTTSRANLDLLNDYRSTNILEYENYEMNIEYLHKIFTVVPRLDLYIGGAYNGHFTYHKRILRNYFIRDELRSHEMGMLSFSVKALAQYKIGDYNFHYKAGTGLVNVGSRPRYSGVNDFEYNWYFPGDFFRFDQSISVHIFLSDNFIFKPQYHLRYYTFEEPERFKMLKQSITIGIYLSLW
jgi:hypothetical protein